MDFTDDEEEIFLALAELSEKNREGPGNGYVILLNDWLKQENVKQSVFDELRRRPEIKKYFELHSDCLNPLNGTKPPMYRKTIVLTPYATEEARLIRDRRAARKNRDLLAAFDTWTRQKWYTASIRILLRILSGLGGAIILIYTLYRLINYLLGTDTPTATMPAPGLFVPM